MIEAAQIKAARALLGLGQVELSKLAGVGLTTLKRLELSDEITGSAHTLWKIQTALEAAGVEFIPADEEKGPGLRFEAQGQREAGQAGRDARQISLSGAYCASYRTGRSSESPSVRTSHFGIGCHTARKLAAQCFKQLLSLLNLLPQGGAPLNCVFRERPML